MKRYLLLLMCLIAIAAQARVKCPVNASDIISMIGFCPTMPVESGEEDAEEFMANAKAIFLPSGFTQGLTGEGYGGPCVIIDGFYKGGYADKERYCFMPTDVDSACVIEISACNDGEDGDYEVYVTMELYSPSNAKNFIDDLVNMGFTLQQSEEDGNICTYSNGTYVVDYAHETEYADDMYFFRIQTVERKTKFD